MLRLKTSQTTIIGNTNIGHQFEVRGHDFHQLNLSDNQICPPLLLITMNFPIHAPLNTQHVRTHALKRVTFPEEANVNVKAQREYQNPVGHHLSSLLPAELFKALSLSL